MSWPAHAPLLAALALVLVLPGCLGLSYDLAAVPVPVSARPAPDGAEAEPFRLEAKNVLWVHGLFGQREPDVGDVLAGALEGAEAVADFRVSQATTFHDWLVTHLTLGFVRMKTVVVEGDLVRAAPETAR